VEENIRRAGRHPLPAPQFEAPAKREAAYLVTHEWCEHCEGSGAHRANRRGDDYACEECSGKGVIYAAELYGADAMREAIARGVAKLADLVEAIGLGAEASALRSSHDDESTHRALEQAWDAADIAFRALRNVDEDAANNADDVRIIVHEAVRLFERRTGRVIDMFGQACDVAEAAQ
jgi:hypothetical protein